MRLRFSSNALLSGGRIWLRMRHRFSGDALRGGGRISFRPAAGRKMPDWLKTTGICFQCAHRRRRGPGQRIGRARHILDHAIAGLEHARKVEWARGAHGLAQRVLGRDDLDAGRLAMIPFGVVARTIGTNYAVFGSDLVPQLCFGGARIPDATHVDRESVGVQGVELVGEPANSECGRSISEKTPADGSPALRASRIAFSRRTANSGCRRPIASSAPCNVIV